MLIELVAVVPVVVAGASYAWMRRRKAQTTARHVYRCPACSQQIRYQIAQAGAKGQCPRCWKSVLLPKAPGEAARTEAPRRGIKFGRVGATAKVD